MLFNVFPLTIYKEKVGLDEATRKEFARIIAEQNKATKRPESSGHESWVGGMHGELSIHLRKEFAPLINEFPKHIRAYMQGLGFRRDDLDIFVTRCWGTYSHGNQTISPHVHTSSVLSIAYYVSLPEGSASISFETESHQNDAIKGLFRESRRSGVIDPNNPLSALAVSIEANEDDLLIFPSSNLHGVRPGRQTDPRISIAADTMFLTKEVSDSEKILPPVSNWKKISS